jgi:hypothetical protein
MIHRKKNISVEIEKKVSFSISLINFTSPFINIVTAILFAKTNVRRKHNWVFIVTAMPVMSFNQNRQQQ